MHAITLLTEQMQSAQGTGQKESGLVDNWGDGLITDKTILAAHPLATSPQAFFEAVLQEPYLSQVPWQALAWSLLRSCAASRTVSGVSEGLCPWHDFCRACWLSKRQAAAYVKVCAAQVVISPHVYPPSISLIENGTSNSGSTLFQRLSECAARWSWLASSWQDLACGEHSGQPCTHQDHQECAEHEGPVCSSFGYLNLPNGFCSSQGDCHQFAVVIGEMGSGLYTDADISFMLDLGLYLHNVGVAQRDDSYAAGHGCCIASAACLAAPAMLGCTLLHIWHCAGHGCQTGSYS